MKSNAYHQAIHDALQGRSEQLRDIPATRLDWAGTGLFLQLFESTSGKNRARFIEAVGRIIEEHELPPAALAELIHLASSLDLAQVEPQVRKLQTEDYGSQQDVKRAIVNYLALRNFSAESKTPSLAAPRGANGAANRLKTRTRSARAHRKAARK